MHLDYMYPSVGIASELKYFYTAFNSKNVTFDHYLSRFSESSIGGIQIWPLLTTYKCALDHMYPSIGIAS